MLQGCFNTFPAVQILPGTLFPPLVPFLPLPLSALSALVCLLPKMPAGIFCLGGGGLLLPAFSQIAHL